MTRPEGQGALAGSGSRQGSDERRWLRRGIALGLAAILGAVAAAAVYLVRPTTLTVAVAPRDGTEPALMTAFAQALAEDRKGVRLKVVLYDDVGESAVALENGRADLAVARPDVHLPTNGLTVAVLRDQAMMLIAPAANGVSTFAALSGKRLGIAAHRDADFALLKAILAYYALRLENGTAATRPGEGAVALVDVDEGRVTAALRAGDVDAVVSIIAPTAPKALALVAAVEAAAPDGRVDFVAVKDDDAILERFPMLQAVTVQRGLFSGRPKVPDDDVRTVGASYRLLARASLNRAVVSDLTQDLFELRPKLARSTEAAAYVAAPSYDTTVAATSARLPNHPGAIDYYERDQRDFVDRYGDVFYLLALLVSAVGSVLAWVRQRVLALRHHRIDEVMESLLAVAGRARPESDPAALDRLADEVEALAAETVRCARDDDPSEKVMTAAAIAVDTARSAVRRRGTESGRRDQTSSSRTPSVRSPDAPSP